MGEGGAYVLYGVLSGQFTPFPVATAFARQLTMRTFALDAARQRREESISTIVTGVENGVCRPTIDRVFPIEQIVEAQLGRAHVLTPVTYSHLVCPPLLVKKNAQLPTLASDTHHNTTP